MTEYRIFEILLQNNINTDYSLDYPKLQENAVNCIAKHFTNIIYDTLKQKSPTSNIKRGNVLKFINTLSEVRECHLHEENYEYFLKVVRNVYKGIGNENVTKLFREINLDLSNHLPSSFADEVITFYRKKHIRQKQKIKELEYIKMMDQEKLNTKYDIQVMKNFSYYETHESLIRELLASIPCHRIDNRHTQQIETDEYRERQVKLAYALLNLKNEDKLVEAILQKLSIYTCLKEYEMNFIQYLWVKEDNIKLPEFLAEKFPFIVERVVLKYSMKLLSYEDKNDVYKFFMDLEKNEEFSKIRKICRKDSTIYYTIKNLIHELYCYSYCNENILKLINFIT